MTDDVEITLEQALGEERELKRDLEAFEAACRIIEGRIRESIDTERYHELQHWPGAHAVLGSLSLSVTAMRNLVQQYHEHIVTLSTKALRDPAKKEPMQ